jgi:hypothetical protein|tara:strand:- start:608 stop:886 length:279 start_codon:yes stop_codon:yes gene_type:complete
MKLKDNKVLSDDGKVIAERERGYGDWISKDDSISISDILDFVNGPVIEEAEVEETEMIRARNDKGHYIADDPTTPKNEAWTTKIIKKLVKKS